MICTLLQLTKILQDDKDCETMSGFGLEDGLLVRLKTSTCSNLHTQVVVPACFLKTNHSGAVA